MGRKTIEEQIAELEQKQKELKNKMKKVKAKQTQEERKARTKRLIEVGAIIEKAIGIEFDTEKKKEVLMKHLTFATPGKTSVADYLKRKIMEDLPQISADGSEDEVIDV